MVINVALFGPPLEFVGIATARHRKVDKYKINIIIGKVDSFFTLNVENTQVENTQLLSIAYPCVKDNDYVLYISAVKIL